MFKTSFKKIALLAVTVLFLFSAVLSANAGNRADIVESDLKFDVNIGDTTAGPGGEVAVPAGEDLPMRFDSDITPYPEKDRKTGEPRELTLQDCVRLALDRSARLRSAGFDVEAAEGQLQESEALFWPVIEYNYKLAPVPTDVNHALKSFFQGQVTLFHSLHAAIGVPIGTFGQLSMAKRMARNGVEAARINEGKARETTIYQVKQLYYGILFAKETIKLLEDAVEKLTNKINDEEAKEEKEMDPYDLLQLKGTRVDLERRVEEAKNNLELAYDGLKIQMDLEPSSEIRLDTDNLKPVNATLAKENDYVDSNMKNSSDLKLLELGVETKRLQYRLEKFKLMPKAGVGFFVDVGRAHGQIKGLNLTDDYNDPFNFTRGGVGLQLKGDIDFHGSYSRIKKARAEYYKAMFDKLVAKRAVNLEIRKAYFQVRRMQEDVKRAKKAESIAEQMTFLSKINVDMGIGEQQRYGDSLKFLLLTRGLYFKAVFDYNVAMADLAQRIGTARYNELTPEAASALEEVFEGSEPLMGTNKIDLNNATTIKGVDNGEFSQ